MHYLYYWPEDIHAKTDLERCIKSLATVEVSK